MTLGKVLSKNLNQGLAGSGSGKSETVEIDVTRNELDMQSAINLPSETNISN